MRRKKKTNKELRDSNGRFMKGHISWLKGTKGIVKPNKTSWKKKDPRIWKGGKNVYFHREARKVMETHLKRKLQKGEIVHHVDKNIKNNNIYNLKLLTKSEHSKIHNHILNIRFMKERLKKWMKKNKEQKEIHHPTNQLVEDG